MSEITETIYIFLADMHHKRGSRVLDIRPYTYIENDTGAGTDDAAGEGGICIQIMDLGAYTNFPLSPSEVVRLRKWLQLQELKIMSRKSLSKKLTEWLSRPT